MSDPEPDGSDRSRPTAEGGIAPAGDVPCPNCCRRARIIRRDQGLLFYECELCLSVGAMPDPDDPRDLSERG